MFAFTKTKAALAPATLRKTSPPCDDLLSTCSKKKPPKREASKENNSMPVGITPICSDYWEFRCVCPDILLTWNCRHIANAVIVGRLRRLGEAHGYTLPEIYTPEE